MLFALLALLLAAGGLAVVGERFGPTVPQRVALAALAVAGGLLAAAGAPGFAAAWGPEWIHGEAYRWIPRFGIALLLGIDGLGLVLVGLTLLLGAVAVLASWTEVDSRPGLFHGHLLWTLAGAVGVFCALDLFAFFVFWEVMLVPMYFLIAGWGHEGRSHAAMKFFLFTQIGGLLMLLSIVGLVWLHRGETGVLTFSYFELQGAATGSPWAPWLLAGFLLAFLVKLPAVPLHSWLPDAHTQAPTAGSVVLAGVLLKTGGYGLVRFAEPLFPEAARALALPVLAVGAASVLYGGLLAFGQRDFKRVVAYSSIGHMGFVVLGVFAFDAVARQGAIVQMVAHGLSSGALFLLAGAVQQRLHTRALDALGGLWDRAPRMGAFALFFLAAALGLPGLGNFVGEFLVLLGSFRTQPVAAVLAALGLVISALYALRLLRRAFHGRAGPALATAPVPDLDRRELLALGVLAAGLLWLGLQPQLVLDLLGPATPVPLTGPVP
jgi:NADH-quinone oxidoreductase subunit M